MNARRGLFKALAAGLMVWLLGTVAALLPRRAAAAEGRGARVLDGRYVNNYIPPVDRSFADVRKAFAEDFPPKVAFELAAKDPAALAANRTRRSATWIGHCTLLVQAGGLNILTDPHFSERASPLPFAGPKRTTPPGLALDELPPVDVVLISHNHYDHLDYRSIQLLREHSPGARYYVPLGLRNWFERAGVANCVERDWWEEDEAAGARVTAVPCQHWSNRSGFDRNRTLWCAWALETGAWRMIFVGDTGYSRDFADIGERFGSFDFAIIPIGAYNPRWFMKDHHQNPEEAVRCMQDLRARQAVATHWGTFQLTLEPMAEPPERLAAAAAAAGLAPDAFTALRHGETRWLA